MVIYSFALNIIVGKNCLNVGVLMQMYWLFLKLFNLFMKSLKKCKQELVIFLDKRGWTIW